MSQIDAQQFYISVEKSLESGIFSPIYFFYGDEPYLISQSLNYIKTCALHKGAADFNFACFYASEFDADRVRDEVETLPMMAPRRVIVLKEVQDISDKKWLSLETLIENPVSSSVLILVGSKIDKRRRIFKLLLEKAISVEFKKPFENQIPGWIRRICNLHNLIIHDDAVQQLHRLVGNQLFEIENEVNKLQVFLGERNEITPEDVLKCVSRRREENVFELTASFAQGNQVESLEHLVQLLDQGQNEIGIVQLIARHMRILLLIKQGQEFGYSGSRLAQHAQVPNYYLKEYIDQARLWSTKKIENCLLVLSDTDRALKSSPVSSHIWLENLILRACDLHKKKPKSTFVENPSFLEKNI